MNQLKKYFKEKDKETQRAEIEAVLKTLDQLKEAEYIRIEVVKKSSKYNLSLEILYNNYINVTVPLYKTFSRKDALILMKKVYFSYLPVKKDTPIYNYIMGKVERYLNLQKSKI